MRPAPPATAPPLLDLLGRGGVGDVYRTRDPDLDRAMAIKILRADRMRDPDQLRRFVAEARVTARLEHPGIVPVHSAGHLPDGRPYFCMKEVKGRTLRDAILQFHQDIDLDPADLRVTVGLRRTIEQLRRACEAMGYAHEQRIVHRDLKPDNILLGPWGEVLVVDWGFAICLDGSLPDTPGQPDALEGTAMYIAPELVQRPGSVASPASDVYSLGAILYAILSGRAPYLGSVQEILEALVRAPPPPPARPGFTPPDDLVQICLTAMSRDPAERYPDAGVLEAEIAAWLEGASARDKAHRAIARAEEMGLMVERLRASARNLRDRAARDLAALPPHAPAARKEPAWAMQEEADRLDTEAATCEEEEIHLLRSALAHAPDLAAAHDRLAAWYHSRHREAEARRDAREAARWEFLLRTHNRGRYDAWLRGSGALSLATAPEAQATLYRCDLRGRRLTPGAPRNLGPTPLRAFDLPAGRYLLRLSAPGCDDATLPLLVQRNVHLRLRHPDGSEPPLRLLPAGSCPPDACYVPAGPFLSGPRLQPIWLPGFLIRRHPISVREYLAFLQALADHGLSDAVRDLLPRDSARPLFRPGPDGRLRPGDEPLDAPVTRVPFEAVTGFAAWISASTGQPWRPVQHLEWEKAARGTDGRALPWGDFADPAFACLRESLADPARCAPGDFPADESPWGVRHLAGNVREWCSSDHGPVLLGGGFLTPAADARLDSPVSAPSWIRAPDIGFRIACPILSPV